MADDSPENQEFDISGGLLCLDFINTLEDRPSPDANERLVNYSDLIDWGRQAGALSAGQASHSLCIEANDPAAAATAFSGFLDLRESMYRIFLAIVDGSNPDPADLAGLNAALGEALSPCCLVPRDGCFVLDWPDDSESLDRVIWPIVRSAADILTSDRLGRVTVCKSPTCVWLFLDTSRNKSRRWCDMKTCGNRAKAQAHYRRTRAQPR